MLKEPDAASRTSRASAARSQAAGGVRDRSRMAATP